MPTVQQSFLPNNIRVLRHLRSMTQVELARRSRLSPAYVSMLERGLQPSRPEHLDQIASALFVSRDALVDGDVRERLLPLAVARCWRRRQQSG